MGKELLKRKKKENNRFGMIKQNSHLVNQKKTKGLISILAMGLILALTPLLLKGNLKLVGSPMVVILAMSWLVFVSRRKWKQKRNLNKNSR